MKKNQTLFPELDQSGIHSDMNLLVDCFKTRRPDVRLETWVSRYSDTVVRKGSQADEVQPVFASEVVKGGLTMPTKPQQGIFDSGKTKPLSVSPSCTVSYRTAPYRTAPHRTVPYRTAPYRSVPHRTVLSRTVPYRTVSEGGMDGRGVMGPHVSSSLWTCA